MLQKIISLKKKLFGSPQDTKKQEMDMEGGVSANLSIAQLVSGIAEKTTDLGVDIANIYGEINDLNETIREQAEELRSTYTNVQEASQANERIGNLVDELRGASEVGINNMANAFGIVTETAEKIKELNDKISNHGAELDNIKNSLSKVLKIINIIDSIASQTHLLSVNTSIEASRSGKYGKGFAVIAGEMRGLAASSAKAAREVAETLNSLVTGIVSSSDSSVKGLKLARDAQKNANILNDFVARANDAMEQVNTGTERIVEESGLTFRKLSGATEKLGRISRGIFDSSVKMENAKLHSDNILVFSEEMLRMIARSGLMTEDTPFIDLAREVATEIQNVFEDALNDGTLSEEDLFDENCVEIPNTNPQQYKTRYLEFMDSVLPEIQEPIVNLDSRIVFAVAVARNGYLPTHNHAFSKAQRPVRTNGDMTWNVANCRNRRFFDDRTGLSAAQNVEPFLLQTYRMDMGGGSFMMMKDISTPIHVRKRHWGAFRIGYRA